MEIIIPPKGISPMKVSPFHASILYNAHRLYCAMFNTKLYLVASGNSKPDDSIESKIAELRLFQRMQRVQQKKLRIQERVVKINMLDSNTEVDAVPNKSLERQQESQDLLSSVYGEGSSYERKSMTKPLRASLPSTFFWEVNFNHFSHKEVDTMIFFFVGLLWKVSFGVNRSSPEYFYYIIAPAQQLERGCKILCEFKLLNESGESGQDYVKRHNCFYHFQANADEVASKGHSKFIHKDQLTPYLRRHASGMRLHLSIDVSTEIEQEEEQKMA